MRAENDSIFRAIDANFNRAGEAIRVIEDVVRFHLDNSDISSDLKDLRHGLSKLHNSLPQRLLIASRDTCGDVGTKITTDSEGCRTGIEQLVKANFRRFAESLRVIEEHLKLPIPGLTNSSHAEQLRYISYILEKKTLHFTRTLWISQVKLMLLYTPKAESQDISAFVKQFAGLAGVAIQLRQKKGTDSLKFEVANQFVKSCKESKIPSIINDRVDICAATNADGVHLGADDLPHDSATSVLSHFVVIGASTHTKQDIKALSQRVDYIGAGPCFPSQTKRFSEFAGAEFAGNATSTFAKPVFAIGGITLENLPLLLEHGVTRIAVSNAICASPNPRQTAEEFLRMLG